MKVTYSVLHGLCMDQSWCRPLMIAEVTISPSSGLDGTPLRIIKEHIGLTTEVEGNSGLLTAVILSSAFAISSSGQDTYYQQVMTFLLRVKRAKFALDKARDGCGSCTHLWDGIKISLILQRNVTDRNKVRQQLMDRVYHSAWSEMCEGMAATGSLDEVIQVHEAYLLSIQCRHFVVLDKLWALIASRINIILGPIR
ncbi:hypothetical protein M8C21_012959 [Ambrosia artemisiifolia]|uniref:Gamma-tubulin complex component n=1 Tax=Ambrosia artemisiifolia TaxID=4212 RepID=A0AAD5CY65_AMBAR|nr:hypothetical protein M8C21_012959 [Ambrosia artemisiifolia]